MHSGCCHRTNNEGQKVHCHESTDQRGDWANEIEVFHRFEAHQETDREFDGERIYPTKQ